MNNLTKTQKEELFTALFYLKVPELKAICEYFDLPTKGEKIVLIENIKYYLLTGKKPEVKQIPAISRAKPHTLYPLAPNTRILYGSFKNDLKTRIFLKSLIGQHFHYTAYGLDWIKNKWFNGEPPTYKKFADYWQQEYTARLTRKGKLKQEWAYLNFLDRYKKEYPDASKSDAINAWEKFRQQQVDTVKALLNQITRL